MDGLSRGLVVDRPLDPTVRARPGWVAEDHETFPPAMRHSEGPNQQTLGKLDRTER